MTARETRPWPRVQPGAHLRLIAPSSPFDVADFERGAERLRERYRVSYEPGILDRSGLFAGDDARRTAELASALADPDVDAIVAARGGYGATRLLPAIAPETVARANKLLVGFSDVTALHALWARAGVGSLHAAMVARLGHRDSRLFARWTRTLEGESPAPVSALTCLAPGRASGPLLGGNLAILAALLGTGYEPPLDGAVLFLEDVSERPYRVDRKLTSLRQAGWLRRVAAVAVGGFTDCAPGPDGVSVEEILAERLGDLGVPVVSGIPAGHHDDNLELPLGKKVTVDATAGTLVFAGEQ